jgi:hypothetical protein
MSPRLLLHELIACEQRIRAWYRALGARNGLPIEARFFWNCMAEDERQHLTMLQQSDRLVDLMVSPPPLSEEVLVRVQALLASAETALRQEDLRVEDALSYTVAIETVGLNELAERWIEGFPGSVGWFLRQSGPEMEVHFRRLIDAVDTLSGDQRLHQLALTLWHASHASRAEHGTVSP